MKPFRSVATAGAICVGTRAAVFLSGYLAVLTIGYGLRQPPRASANEFLNLPARWDSQWYLGIASGGYRWDPARPPYERLKFFPAYPLLLRAFALPLDPGRHEVRWMWIGVVLSTLLFWLALLYLFRLSADLQGEQAAGRALWCAACYPFAIFFGLPYSESLFLASTLGAVSSYRQGRWATSAAWGCVAGATRPNGFLLTLVLALLKTAGRDSGSRRPFLRAGAVVAPLLGVALFTLYLYATTGDATAWIIGQPGGRTPMNPALFLRDLAVSCAQSGVVACAHSRGYDVVNIAATLFAIASIVPVFRRFGAAFAAFIALNIAMPLAGVGFNCMGRYTSVLFPVFLWLAGRGASSFRWWIVASFLAECLAAAAFFTWRPIY